MTDPRIPAVLRFALLFGVQLVLLAATQGPASISFTPLLLAALIASAATFVWGLATKRPLADRGHANVGLSEQSPTSGDAGAGAALAGRPSNARQRRLAGYARRLRNDLALFRAVFEQSADAVLIVDPTGGRLLDCNPRAKVLFGVPDGVLPELRFVDMHLEDPARLSGLLGEVMQSGRNQSLRIDCRGADGGVVPTEVSLSRIEVEGGNLLLCVARDIRERDDAAQRIEHLAYHDVLTNLPNRSLLTDRVSRALARHRRTGLSGALLFLDLDRFKRINDSLGHAIGDELLKEVSRRLRAALREEDTVARLGGDEFVVLLEGLGRERAVAVATAREIAQKIRSTLGEEYLLHGHALYVTGSIGIVTFPHDGDDVDRLLRHADTAMYHAKGSGRNGAQVFEGSMDEAALSRLRVEEELRIGLREQQFQLYLQPFFAIRGGHILGAEVLLRWHHPTAGLIAPSEFMPHIENCGLMLKLDDWVLSEACRLLSEIQADPALHMPDSLAVNVSQQQFHQSDFVDRVANTLANSGVDPGRLQFEITETALMKDASDSVERMNALKKMGIRFAIDDFGTGYSSLADLRLLPIDTIKIDRSFIQDVATDPHDAAIVRAILSMARHIGLEVVAEGVESRAQLQFLREAECTCYQGFLGRPPLSVDGFREELRFSADLYPPQKPETRGDRMSADATKTIA